MSSYGRCPSTAPAAVVRSTPASISGVPHLRQLRAARTQKTIITAVIACASADRTSARTPAPGRARTSRGGVARMASFVLTSYQRAVGAGACARANLRPCVLRLAGVVVREHRRRRQGLRVERRLVQGALQVELRGR